MSVPQTFNDVIALLGTAVNRPDVAPSYIDFINRAVRDSAAAHSFDQMKATMTVTLAANSNSVQLNAAAPNGDPLWKEPQNGRFWAFAAIGASPSVPVPIYNIDELERLNFGGLVPNPYLVYTQDGGFQLGLIPPAVAATAWTILVKYFAYPAMVTNPANGTPLLTFYPNLILSKTLSLIFQFLNDPIWQTHEQAWQTELQRVTGVDLAASKAGPHQDKDE